MDKLKFSARILLGLTILTAGVGHAEEKKPAESLSPPLAGYGKGGKQLYYFMVFSNATPGMDAEFNKWYDEIHAPVLIEGGDYIWAQRFELVPESSPFSNGTPELRTRRYLVIFALETADPETAAQEVRHRLAMTRNVASPALDYSSLQSVTWRALGPPTTQAQAIRMLAEETARGIIPPPGTMQTKPFPGAMPGNASPGKPEPGK